MGVTRGIASRLSSVSLSREVLQRRRAEAKPADEVYWATPFSPTGMYGPSVPAIPVGRQLTFNWLAGESSDATWVGVYVTGPSSPKVTVFLRPSVTVLFGDAFTLDVELEPWAAAHDDATEDMEGNDE